MPQRKEGLMLVLHYRSGDEVGYERRDLAETMAGEFTGRVPADAVRRPRLYYFFEVYDERGKVVVRLGSADKPFTVPIKEAPPPPPPPPSVAEPRILVGLGAGTSLGVVHGKSDTYKREIKTGTAFAPFHVSVEVGYAFTPSWEVSLAARFGLVPGTTYGVEPRVRWLALTEGVVRPYLQFGVIISKLRNSVDLRPVVPDDDTITAGDVGIGVGGGVSFLLSRNVGLGLEVHTMTIFPDTTFAIDAGVKLRLRF
jgi:hypothetical protein